MINKLKKYELNYFSNVKKIHEDCVNNFFFFFQMTKQQQKIIFSHF